MRNFYSTDHAPYYICALNYIQQSAGVRALHYLCHALNESGLEAYVTCEVTAPHLRTPLLTGAVLSQHHASGRKPIVVYPEIFSGDPLAAGGVIVRWLLNKPGLIGGDAFFNADDMIFTYSSIYLPDNLRGPLLHIPTCDLSVFHNKNNSYDKTRDIACFYAHKYLHAGGKLTQQAENAISLGKEQILTHVEIAALLRRARVLYVYEPTALVVEALLCGCPVSIVETNYWRDNVKNFDCGTDGVVFGGGAEAVARAKENIHLYEAKYQLSIEKAWFQLDRFITLTQKKSGLSPR